MLTIAADRLACEHKPEKLAHTPSIAQIVLGNSRISAQS